MFFHMNIMSVNVLNPNSINIVRRIKQELSDNVSFSGNKFNLVDDYSESEFISDIMRIHDARNDLTIATD